MLGPDPLPNFMCVGNIGKTKKLEQTKPGSHYDTKTLNPKPLNPCTQTPTRRPGTGWAVLVDVLRAEAVDLQVRRQLGH